ncbi:hypothetical protein BDZ91DRAFT_243498 [Kalaharituber pfeilii]|nr:hypothetical protein BDZ91DRAFT_243498 [Kalaharituber pfeilii]
MPGTFPGHAQAAKRAMANRKLKVPQSKVTKHNVEEFTGPRLFSNGMRGYGITNDELALYPKEPRYTLRPVVRKPGSTEVRRRPAEPKQVQERKRRRNNIMTAAEILEASRGALRTRTASESSASSLSTLSENNLKRRINDITDGVDTPSAKRLRRTLSCEQQKYGILQEEFKSDAFRLLLVTIFFSTIRAPNPVEAIQDFFENFTTPLALAQANHRIVSAHLRRIPGVTWVDGKNMIKFAKSWVKCPPKPMAKTVHNFYTKGEDNLGWEIGHLWGVGAVAIDAWRIFCRDRLYGHVEENEWRSVVTDDPRLNAYLRWRKGKEDARLYLQEGVSSSE